LLLARKLKQQQQQQQQQQQIQTPNRKRNVVSDGWAGEDVNIFREEEFDFQKNLDMFDKAKVFAEIRVSVIGICLCVCVCAWHSSFHVGIR
jgi:hypothetical protein